MASPQNDKQFNSKESSTTFTNILTSQGVDFLLRSDDSKVPLSSIDDGGNKTVCLFFSANWCRPCKTFTPQLVQVYHKLQRWGKKIEIIFISSDRDEEGFKAHFKSMPWLSVPFDVNLHRRISKLYNVDHLPSFIPVVVGSDGNGIISAEDDAVAMIEDYGADAFPFTKQRKEELRLSDDAKRLGGKLEQLLAFDQPPNHLISGHGREMKVSDVFGKTLGLYFAAQWSPPCRAFTIQLIEAYNELLLDSPCQSFEVVLVSTDKDHEEFDSHVSKMPWLAIPYKEEKMRQDLCRIFQVKKIPSLVIIGPDGQTITMNGRGMISMYGAKAFPFTQGRIGEIEAALRKEGEGMPSHLKDPKHDHVLKLDMANAYVCDFCRKPGRFWTFSCPVCNYDLHPTCTIQIQSNSPF
ncbi:Protein-disulfide reductase [Bertholletia excelsa]